jgi:beta-galactosidase/beta-glucuronidase
LVKEEYPQPQFQRASWQNLNGKWNFCFDDQNIGLDEGWPEQSDIFQSKINVPFVYQCKLSGLEIRDVHDVIWYQRTFSINKKSEKEYLLHFGAIDYSASIFVNGRLVAEHDGGETSFAINITAAVTSGINNLVVRVEDYHQDESISRGKQSWEEPPTAIWYTNTTGIWQTVWLEEVATTHIEKLFITPYFDDGTVQIKIHLNNFRSRLKIKYAISMKEEHTLIGSINVNQAVMTVNVDLFQNHIFRTNYHRSGWSWTPENPNLFDLKLALVNGTEELDKISSYFGMRKISQKNGMVYLNNQPYYQKLVLDQGYWPDGLLTAPSDEAFIKDIQLAKSMGFNGCRKHQKVEDPRFLYWADRLGFLVWEECASFPSYTNDAATRLINAWNQIVDRDYNHPCIVTWVPLNESWGVPNIQRNRQQQHFSQALFHQIKSLDTTRLVISNDGWSQTETDLCTIHNYAHGKVGEEEQQLEFKKTLSDLSQLLSYCPAGKQIYADGFHWQGEPFVLSEFGGISYQKSQQQGWGYTAVHSEEDFLHEYERLLKDIYSSKILWGFCYTQLTDVEQEINGLLTYDRQLKLPLEKIKVINSQYHSSTIQINNQCDLK